MPLPGGAVAVYGNSGIVQYNHADWLGSARLFSTAEQAPNAAMAYAPFGEGYAGGEQYVQFTTGGDEWTVFDPENGSGSLVDFTYRRYSPTQGRWISPDPAGRSAVDPTNPQSWNRYAYVGNNPLSRTDPTGLQYLAGHWVTGSQAGLNCMSGQDGAICGPSVGPTCILDGAETSCTMIPVQSEFDFMENNYWQRPSGYPWVAPGQGEPDLIANGALVNVVTDQIWVDGVGAFLNDPKGTLFILAENAPFVDVRIFNKHVRASLTVGAGQTSAKGGPTSFYDALHTCAQFLPLILNGSIMTRSEDTFPTATQDGTTVDNRNREYDPAGQSQGSGAGNAAGELGAWSECVGAAPR